jgi:hypothetical protein
MKKESIWKSLIGGTVVFLIFLVGARGYHLSVIKRKRKLYETLDRMKTNSFKSQIKSIENKRYESCKMGYVWAVSILAFDKKFKFKELRKTGVLREIGEEVSKKCDYFYPRSI